MSENKEQGNGVSLEDILPADGIVLPVAWNSLGVKLTDEGVIDKSKMEALMNRRGGMSAEERDLLEGSPKIVRMTRANAGFLLNILWAVGLANEHPVLLEGPMMDQGREGAGRFASTGGWNLARGSAMDHYAAHAFVPLTEEQSNLVSRVASRIYRPCCGNSTAFPDCNHGMAMLGLLELMAQNGVSEGDMENVALQVNAFWFPDTYLAAARYFAMRGVSWEDVDPREVLGPAYSSAQGAAQIRREVEDVRPSGGGSGCGV